MNTPLDWIVKNAGILDPPKDRLSPKVWTTDQKLLPAVKKQILKGILSILADKYVKEVMVLGSITGYKWTHTSDVDVSIYVEDLNEDYSKTKATKNINGQKIPGSDHAINYFVRKYYPEVKERMAEHDWGVYDVISDKWIKHPGDPSSVKQPSEEFFTELRLARQKNRAFEDLVSRWLKAKDQYDQALLQYDPSELHVRGALKSYRQRKDKLYEDLADFVLELDKQRKIDYSTAFGIARIGRDNIIFKFIEHGPYTELFEELKEYNSKRKDKSKWVLK